MKRGTVRMMLVGALASIALGVSAEASAEPKTHDGFYMQLDTGLGYLKTSPTDVSFSGVSIPFQLLLGGSPVPGLVIGGGLITDYAPSISVSQGGNKVSGLSASMYLVGIGPFVDIYPDPHSGLHFQGMLGFGALSVSQNGNSGNSPSGFLMSLGGGYDWWVANEWSIGVMGRLAYAPLSLDSQSYPTISPALLATFTYQ